MQSIVLESSGPHLFPRRVKQTCIKAAALMYFFQTHNSWEETSVFCH